MDFFSGTRILRIAVQFALVLTCLWIPGCGSDEENTIMEVQPPPPQVIVYGRDTCGITTATRSALDDEKIRHIYKDVDVTQNGVEMWKKVYAASWYQGGSVGLPVVDVKGDVWERPSIEDIKTALDAP